ncbi:phage protease [Acinetobacter sp. ACZLY 512]|uniref:phage protease n=1 Tax=Acinetobacter sp. ACZLY 512 TaxID=2911206 RepID=UPI002026936C|nr:phage protease [Acinetobacter sp. ACZLY 512]MCL9676958.1 phage protease [Acinetobacter sp. ACZLY 512]
MKKTLLTASCAFDLSTTQNHMVLIPEGIFRGLDGRPFDAPHWNLTPERGQQMAAALNQRTIDMVIDYEHATLKAQELGAPAPASGWLKSGAFTYVSGVGLCSTQFEWTDKAKEFIASEEYKYLSPVFLYNPTGEILGLLHVALTNTPALDQLPEAKLAAAAQDYFSQNLTQQDSEMDELLEQLRWMLNLPLSATAEEIMAELSKLQAQIKDKTGVAVAANSQNLFDAIAAIDQIKMAANSQAKPDLTQFVPMAVYQEAVAKAGNADAAIKAKEIDDLIVAACSDGRLTGEATINWVKDQAKTNPDFVKAHLEGLPKIAALTQKQTQQLNLAANHQQHQQPVDDITASIASQFGLDPATIGA